MRASLVSREVIADSIELMTEAHDFDALVCLVGCDKTVPAALMAAARVDRPAVVLSGGPMLAGRLGERRITIQDVWEALGAHERGRASRADLDVMERTACPGAGYCAGNFTANTMAIVVDLLGLGIVGDGLIPAAHLEDKDAAAARAGSLAVELAATRDDRTQPARPARAGERDGRRRGQRRLDEHLPAPARHRPRGGRPAHARRPRRGQRAHAGRRRPAPRRALGGGGPARRRRHGDADPRARPRRPRRRRRPDRRRPDARRGDGRRARARRPGVRLASSRAGRCMRCAATSRRRAR